MSCSSFNFVAHAAQQWAQSVALIDSVRTMSFAQVHEEVTAQAEELRSSFTSIETNDSKKPIIPVEGTASCDYVVKLLAVITAGGVAAPLNMRYPESVRAAQKRSLSTCPHGEGILLVQTSGSSGAPKGVLLSLENLLTSAAGVNERLSFDQTSRWLCPLPLWHVGGLGILFRCLISGGTMILSDSSALADTIRTHSPSHLSLVDAQLSRLLEDDSLVAQLKTICRAVLLGGSAISTGRIQQGTSCGLPLYLSYGLTEMSSTVTIHCVSSSDLFSAPLTSGTVLNGRQLRISSGGVIEVNGPTRCLGYLSDGALIIPFDAEGWYATGDRGTLGERGELIVYGRADNMFISGGENIQPEEIESHLRTDSRIDEVVIVPVPHTRYGHRPVAIIRLNRKFSLPEIEAEFASLLRAHLPGYMVPDNWINWPKSSTNSGALKIDRRQLQEYAALQISPRQESK